MLQRYAWVRSAMANAWLTGPDPEHLMKPAPEELMTMWKIGRDVGNPRNNRPDLLDEVKDDLFDL